MGECGVYRENMLIRRIKKFFQAREPELAGHVLRSSAGQGCVWGSTKNVVGWRLNERGNFQGYLKAGLQRVGNRKPRQILEQENKVTWVVFSEGLFDKFLPFGLGWENMKKNSQLEECFNHSQKWW